MIYKKPVNGKYWVAGKGIMGSLFKGIKTLKHNGKIYEMSNIIGYDDFINEAKMDDYYQVSYYAQVGEHGALKSHDTFEKAFKEAVRKKTEWKNDIKDDAKPNEAIWYIGVEGNGDDFAVVFINEKYLESTDAKHFKSKAAFDSWMKVAKNVMSTGMPQKGKYK